MIDDNPDNAAGALAVEINGLLFQSDERLRACFIGSSTGQPS
jgi:hypothetical protein